MAAIERVTADPALHTPDLGGQATTAQVTAAVNAAIAGANLDPRYNRVARDDRAGEAASSSGAMVKAGVR